METSGVSKHVLPPRLARKKGLQKGDSTDCSTAQSEIQRERTAQTVFEHRVPLKHVQTQVTHAETIVGIQTESQTNIYPGGDPHKTASQSVEVENLGEATESRPTWTTKLGHESGITHKGNVTPRRGTKHGPRSSGPQQLRDDNSTAHVKHTPDNKRKAEYGPGEGNYPSGRPKRTRQVPERFR